jgi:flagellar assembly factor FliW
MEKIQTRFGIIEYEASNLLHFPAGMIGLPNLRNFIVIPAKKDGPLFWIQNVDDPDFAFILTDPGNFFLDYKIQLDESEKNSLQIENAKDCYTLSIVTVPSDQNITINLAAPILYSPETNRAIQVVLEDNKYQTKTPLPQA